jgi:hypothetical protein
MNIEKKEIAILVPLSKRSGLSDEERISLRHLTHYLADYPKFFVTPRSGTFRHQDLGIMTFPDKYFGSVKAHNRLLMSEGFYRSFLDYEYIMIYHLDSLVFSSGLDLWCAEGFDLVAPPWIPGPDLPWLKEPGVGNGGLSLRRVESFLRILQSRERWRNGSKTNLANSARFRRASGSLQALKDYRFRFRYLNGIKHEIRNYVKNGGNEDRFWWARGRKYYPEFNIAPVETALKFGFEGNPRRCLELSGGELPFGCHAWERFDRRFWEPFLLLD